MKRMFIAVYAALMICCASFAQDARQRTVETIAQDVLAVLPTDNLEEFYVQMKDLADAAPESVEYLAKRLKPSDSAGNSIVEYAISGVVRYASDPACSSVKDNVLKGLKKAAASSWDKYNRQFLESQIRLLQPYDGDFEAYVRSTYPVEAAKSLEKSEESRKRCQALWLYSESLGAKSEKYILAALKDPDRAVRTTALLAFEPYAGDDFYAKVAKSYKKLSATAKADVIYWFGEKNVKSQTALVLSEMKTGGEIGANAVEAAGKIGGEEAAESLVAMLGGDYTANAVAALKYVDHDISDMVVSALAASEEDELRCKALLELASSRRIVEAAPYVYTYAASVNDEIASAASDALSGVVSASDFRQVAAMYDSSQRNLASWEDALMSSLSSLSADDRYSLVRDFADSAAHPERFYMAMAESDTDQAASYLTEKYASGSEKALEALARMSNINVADVLLDASDKDQEYLRKYVDVIERNITDPERKFVCCYKALDKASDISVLNHIIDVIGSVPTMNAFNAIAPYLDVPATAYKAADAVKRIASANASGLDYYRLQEILVKAASVFSGTGDADDGYAVDEIRKILEAARPYEKFVLSEEEKRQGYEVLFDGTDLSKWVGDKVGYTAVNGCIEVSAGYGDEKNLYTEQEYSDFILRFDFCFEKEGVNNGVGIRTPMGVDAAYYGMCEVQILDHDAPVYADLKPYQVHGSVYGIVPAKRIVHKPLGEWSSQEIKVVGDRVTVIVNGEVILDANVIKACKGNNVAPDGSDVNPYTVDGRNHPGLFNKKGHVGFLGHGSGLKYRNVRILDLSSNKR